MISIILDNLFGILIGYLFADFIIGIYHWIKDTYFSPYTPLVGDLFIWNSRLHHVRPTHVTTYNDLDMIKTTAQWTFLWMAPLMYYIEFSSFTITLFLMISINDIVHKYAHMSVTERPKWITFMQNIKVFQTQEEHHLHHIEPYDTYYCPITPYLNGPLEKINFWKKNEYLIEKYLKISPRSYKHDFVEDDNYPAKIRFVNPS